MRNLALPSPLPPKAAWAMRHGARTPSPCFRNWRRRAPTIRLRATTLHFAQGMLAVAQKDMKAARTHFDMCIEPDFMCHWQALEVSRKAGDKAGADASLARLMKLYVRDPLYVYAHHGQEWDTAKVNDLRSGISASSARSSDQRHLSAGCPGGDEVVNDMCSALVPQRRTQRAGGREAR